jgi:hypothetical protein
LARSLRNIHVLEAAGAEVARALQIAGIPSLLLKGGSLSRWLYGPGDVRPSVDVDLLVRSTDVSLAENVLTEQGFERQSFEVQGDRPWVSHQWIRPRDGLAVDLHRSLIGVGVDPAILWEALVDESEDLEVAGRTLRALRPQAKAFHVALHAAEHGTGGSKALEDLRRALERVPIGVWAEAADLARRLDAVPAFAGGLRLLPAGERLASHLRLPPTIEPIEVSLRLRGAPPHSIGLAWLLTRHGAAAKAALIARKLVPPREFIEGWSPRARRGTFPLIAAYLRRPFWLARHSFPAWRAWRRAKKS